MAAENKASGRQVQGAMSDVYTALLGLAFLALAATTALVCIYGQQMHGTIFKTP